LIGAGILIGWLRPWESEHPVPAAGPIANKPLDSRQRGTFIPPPSGSTESTGNLEQQVPAQRPASAAQAGSAPANAAMKPGMPAVTDTETRRALARPAGTAAKGAATSVPSAGVTAQAKSVGDQRVIAMSELPVSTQQEIPRMSVALHAYSSNPSGRLVVINDRLLHEGAQVGPSLRLEEITPDGMIFTFKEFRFHLGAHGSGR
jgi:general secretion pathway protein B